jgi:translocation and assembly module TamB
MDQLRSPRRTKRGWRRAFRIAGRALAALLVFIVAVPVLALFALQFPSLRAFVAKRVDSALATSFEGRIHLRELERIDLGGLRASGSVDDPRGHTILRFEHVTVNLDVPRLVVGAIRHGGSPELIVVDEIAVKQGELTLIDDGQGSPTLAETFQPRTPSAPSTAPSPRVELRRIDVAHLWTHGAVGTSPYIDVDLSKVSASLVSDSKALSVELSRLELDERFPPFNPHGSIKAKAVLPSGATPPSVSASYDGTVAGTKLQAQGSYGPTGVSAELLLPSIDAAAVRRLAPELELKSPVRVSLKADGPLDHIVLRGEAQGDALGAVRIDGTARASAPQSAELELQVNRLNAAAVAPTAPQTDLDAKLSLSAKLDGEHWQGHYELALTRGSAGGEALPALETHGAASGQGSSANVDGTMSVHEPGAETELGYRVSARGSDGRVEAELESKLDDPPRVKKLAGVETRGRVSARALFAWPSSAFDATADVRLDGVRHPSARTGAVRAKLVAHGTVAEPVLRANVFARSLQVQGRKFQTVDVAFNGTPAKADVGLELTNARGQGLKAHALLVTAPGKTELVGPSLAFRDQDGTLQRSAESVTLTGPAVDVERFVLDGAGHAGGTLHLRGKRLDVEAQTRELNLGRLLKVAGVESPVHSARATLDVRYAGPLNGRGKGKLHGEITQIGYGHVTGGWTSMNLELGDSGVSGMLEAELVKGAKVVVGVDDIVPAALANGKSWAPHGRVRVRGKLDLESLAPLAGKVSADPIEHAKGTVDLELAYARDSDDALPEIKAHVQTHDLTLIGRREPRNEIGTPSEAIDAAPAVYRGVDLGLDLALDERNPQIAARATLYDKHGTLLELEATAGPWLDESIEQVVAGLGQAPLEVKASMPARSLVRLPQPLRPLSVRGQIAGDAKFTGTLAAPHLVVDVRASRLTSAGERIVGEKRPSVAVVGHVEYAPDGGKAELIAQRDRAKAVDVDASWSGNALLAASDPKERDRLKLKLDAVLDELALDTIPALKNRQIEGVLSGTVHADYAADRRMLAVDLAAHPLKIGQASLDHVNVELAVTPRDVKGVVLVRGKSGSLDAELASGLTWPAGGVPALSGAIEAKLAAKGFRLATLAPLLGSAVNELDGRFDADMAANVQGDRVTLRGKGQLSDGVVQLPAIGQRFERMSAKIDVEPSMIVVSDLKARGLTGEILGSARVEVDEHLGLRELNAEVAIPKHQKLPVTVQGVAMGDAWGHLTARVKNGEDKVEVSVVVPELHLFVPDSAGGDVQDLAPDAEVRIGVRRQDKQLVALPVQPLAKPSENSTPLELTLELGKNVEVRKGDLVTAQVTGKINVHVAERTSVTGEIDVKGGTLDVSGKEFHIERGTVTFTADEPGNPTVAAEARWDAPAGYAVYATYTGTAKKGKLSLRSEPPLTQEEIYNLILFGTPEGSVSSGSGDTATSAVGAVGGTATKGINRALSDFTHLDIQARIDTSTGESRPELLVPVNKRLSARVTHSVGEPAPGTSPDRTFVTLELRLKQLWLLSATFGDRGASALDLMWRKHY